MRFGAQRVASVEADPIKYRSREGQPRMARQGCLGPRHAVAVTEGVPVEPSLPHLGFPANA
jgi:hypothetical protein